MEIRREETRGEETRRRRRRAKHHDGEIGASVCSQNQSGQLSGQIAGPVGRVGPGPGFTRRSAGKMCNRCSTNKSIMIHPMLPAHQSRTPAPNQAPNAT